MLGLRLNTLYILIKISMNKLFAPVMSFGIIALMATSMVACNSGTNSQVSTVIQDSSSNNTGNKIVYVNADSLFEKYEYFREIRNNLEAKAKKAQSDLQSRSMAFQREVTEYQEKAPVMSAADRQSTEERLARKQDELAQHQQNASAALAQDEAAEQDKLYTKITEYLKEHAQANGYLYVLTYSMNNPAVLYADESMEITSEVIQALNQKHQAEKK